MAIVVEIDDKLITKEGAYQLLTEWAEILHVDMMNHPLMDKLVSNVYADDKYDDWPEGT